jgi:hypothetical protein
VGCDVQRMGEGRPARDAGGVSARGETSAWIDGDVTPYRHPRESVAQAGMTARVAVRASDDSIMPSRDLRAPPPFRPSRVPSWPIRHSRSSSCAGSGRRRTP